MRHEAIQFVGISPTQFKTDLLEDVKDLIIESLKAKTKDEDQFLTRKEVAELVGGVSVNTVINWAKKGILTEYGIGSLIRYKKSEVKQALIKLNS